MGELTTLMARDGHEFQAYLAAAAPAPAPGASAAGRSPPGGARPRGAVVVIQEIFGVNAHIRAVTDGFAAEGYTAIAPSLFDRVRRGITLGYSQSEVEEGRGYKEQIPPEQAMKDIAAAVAVVRHSGRVATVGYCWGGALSYRAACELPLGCAVVYYGHAQDAGSKPRCRVMYHFGTADRSIPLAEVERMRAANPEGIFHLYEGAGHGFNCDLRPSYVPDAAALARRRTLDFLAAHLTANPARGEDEPENS